MNEQVSNFNKEKQIMKTKLKNVLSEMKSSLELYLPTEEKITALWRQININNLNWNIHTYQKKSSKVNDPAYM